MRFGAAIALGLFFVGSTPALRAAAEDVTSVHGYGLIQRVDPAQRRVLVDGKSLALSTGTVIDDGQGHPITIQQLPSLESGASADAAAVHYEGRPADSGGVIPVDRLTLTGQVPR